MTVSGDVVEIHSHWTEGGEQIVTDATVATPNGMVVVNQLGGTADGVGQIVLDDQPQLKPGMTVDIVAHEDVNLSNATHIVANGVKLRS